MAGSLTAAELDALATTLAGNITQLSVHTASPGTTGTNEATGGSPAYARKSVTCTHASGTVTVPSTTFDLPAGTYTHVGFWNGSTFVGYGQLGTSQVLSSQGQLIVSGTVPFTAS